MPVFIPAADSPQAAPPARALPPPPRTPLPCVHLGEQVGDADCPVCPNGTADPSKRVPLYACAVHGETTARRGAPGKKSCHACKDYKTAEQDCGVVVGAYTEWPELIELQIRLIRSHCGPAPVLIADDCSPADLRSVCGRYENVWYWPNASRIGHSGGDLSVFWKGLAWARASGLRVLAKLSQRYLVDRPGWLRDGAKALRASGLPLATRRCRGQENFPHRTEAVLLDVEKWSAPAVLADLRPRPVGAELEGVFDAALRKHFGPDFHPWDLLGSEDRYRPTPGVVWHCANGPGEYRQLALRYGLTLPAGFHTDGWFARQPDYLLG